METPKIPKKILNGLHDTDSECFFVFHLDSSGIFGSFASLFISFCFLLSEGEFSCRLFTETIFGGDLITTC